MKLKNMVTENPYQETDLLKIQVFGQYDEIELEGEIILKAYLNGHYSIVQKYVVNGTIYSCMGSGCTLRKAFIDYENSQFRIYNNTLGELIEGTNLSLFKRLEREFCNNNSRII